MHVWYLVALLFGGIFGTSFAAVTEVSTGITASANGWDTRTEGYGCAPSGCVADNVLDDSIEDVSRWSCKAEASGVEACELTLVFDEPQDILEIRIALYKGDQRSRSVNVLVDGNLVRTIASSGTTTAYEPYNLTATQATTIVLQAAGVEDNGWLSITGVQLMVDHELEESPPSPAPTGDDYVGCFTDMVSDRVLTIVMTNEDLTPEVCAAACAEMDYYFYGLQQGDECWCAGCDLTDNDTNTNYDRHGEDSCSAACAGDSTSKCGGDMAISLYQIGSCVATPAPTPSIPTSECPSTSIPSSLEISLTWEQNSDLDLRVIEPGGFEVYYGERLGDVGMVSDDNTDGPGSETFILLNGLSVDDDMVLGDYKAYVANGDEGVQWILTARSGGELLWVEYGEVTATYESDKFTATVTEYSESDCNIEAYGRCPFNALSSDGTPPCTTCPSGEVSDEGATFCTVGALQYLNLPENIANAIVDSAVGGFAGPGVVELDGKPDIYEAIIIEEDEAAIVELSGTFTRNDGGALPTSTALFVYIDDENTPSDYVRGQGEIDVSTGEFTATVTDIPNAFSRVVLSFVVLDPADTPDEQGADTVFLLYVANNACGTPLSITLKWDTDNSDFDLYITDPSGYELGPGARGDVGFVIGDNTNGFGPETFYVYNGLSVGDDDVLGEYTAEVFFGFAQTDTRWTLTARVDGEVVWTEGGKILGSYSSDRRLSTSSSTTTRSRSELYTVSLDSYESVDC